MVFAIHAYEDSYSGLHSIEDWGFEEGDTENDEHLHDLGRQLSYQVIESYGFLEEDYVGDEEEYESMDEDELEDIINEHLVWDVIPLPGAPSVDACWEYLSEHNDPEGLIEMYSKIPEDITW